MNSSQENSQTLTLLQSIGEEANLSQRLLAQRMGVALGLANSYLKRCVHKGWVKVQQIPGNRYLYYLTPQGFIEKSRLSAEYLTSSLALYRKAGDDYLRAFDICLSRGWSELVLCGVSELAEIALIRSCEREVAVVSIYGFESQVVQLGGIAVVNDIQKIGAADAYLLTALQNPVGCYEKLRQLVPQDRIIIPSILAWQAEEPQS
ncbi:MAG: winged helix-turn-helix transcriptional regulator [Gammaproteobacteria bacterium]|nr:winged helix-turn-helix transcriptional regulator [Gammaproteobacteria bacterium]